MHQRFLLAVILRLRPTLIRAARFLPSTPYSRALIGTSAGGNEAGSQFEADERLYFAEELRISSISFRKCQTCSSASRSTAFSQSGGGEPCARASALSLG